MIVKTDGTILSLGIMTEAPRLRDRPISEPINADAAGGIPADYLAMGRFATLDLVLAEYNSLGCEELLKTAGGQGTLANVATPMVDLYHRIVFGIGIGAQLGKHNVFIARCAAIAPNYPLDLLMGSKLRQVPVQLQLFPYNYPTTGGNLQCYELYTDSTPPIGNPADATSYAAHRTLSAFLAATT